MASQYENLENEALFELYRKGDLAAFDHFYERMSPKIWGFIKKKIESTAHAEDIYQEVWSKVHRSKEQYDSKFPLNPWVFTIARSVLFDQLRHVQRNREALLDEENMDQKISEASLKAEASELTFDWESKLASLTPEQREIIQLRYLKDWSFAEIAKSLGLNEDNVRQKISRIVKRIRGRLV